MPRTWLREGALYVCILFPTWCRVYWWCLYACRGALMGAQFVGAVGIWVGPSHVYLWLWRWSMRDIIMQGVSYVCLLHKEHFHATYDQIVLTPLGVWSCQVGWHVYSTPSDAGVLPRWTPYAMWVVLPGPNHMKGYCDSWMLFPPSSWGDYL